MNLTVQPVAPTKIRDEYIQLGRERAHFRADIVGAGGTTDVGFFDDNDGLSNLCRCGLNCSPGVDYLRCCDRP